MHIVHKAPILVWRKNFKERAEMTMTNSKPSENPSLRTPSDISPDRVQEIADGLNAVLANVFAMYLKTKNFHWHMSGPHFRDYHLLLDGHGDQLFSITDPIAERVRKIGGTTLRSIGDISRQQHVKDNDADFVAPEAMMSELHQDELALVQQMLAVHGVCEKAGDVATSSLLENYIDDSQRRSWFLFEICRR